MNLQFESLDELKDFVNFLVESRRGNEESAVQIGEMAHEAASRFVQNLPAGVVMEHTAALDVDAGQTQAATAPAVKPARRGSKKAEAEAAAAANVASTSTSTDAATDTAAAGAPDTAQIAYESEADIRAALLERAAELGEVDPAKHLNDSRSFIQSKGLPAYYRTQQLASVGDNAIVYTPHDRAMHTAAMEYFMHCEAKIPPASAVAA